MELKIGKVIAHARRAKDMTQEALADTVGVSSAAVSKWETGASYPDITLLPPLARALGLTVDALLDFHPAPTDQELQALSARLRGIFDKQGFDAGKQEAETLLREYPSSGSLKLIVGGLYFHYISFALSASSQPEQTMNQLSQCCLALFEQGEQQTDNPNEALAARSMRVSVLCVLERYDEAEQLVDTFPKGPVIDADILRQNIYLARGQFDEAGTLTRRALLTHVSSVSTALMQLITIARRQGDYAAARRFADAYDAVDALFRLDTSNGILLQLSLAQDEQDRERMLSLFEQYIDALLSYSLDYRDNIFFSGVQTHVPTPNEIAKTQQLLIRAIKEDERFAALRGEPRFDAALERLQAAVAAASSDSLQGESANNPIL